MNHTNSINTTVEHSVSTVKHQSTIFLKALTHDRNLRTH